MALLDHWHPVTSDMGLVNATHSRITESHAFSDVFEVQGEIASGLEDALSLLPPLSMEKKRGLLVPTKAGWTAYFASGIQGSDPFPFVSLLARELGVLAMRVCSTSNRYAANIWEVYAPRELGGSPPLGHRRSIAAANDGGRWIFEQSGQPFSFEDLSAYSASRTRDRFTREQLQRYLASFGLNPFDESFYSVAASSPAVLVTRIADWECAPPSFTLAEVRNGVPWRR